MMSIVLLQAATGDDIEGPIVRVPIGNYKIEKSGSFTDCVMHINNAPPLLVNSKIILSNHSNIKLTAKDAKGLTVRFIREN